MKLIKMKASAIIRVLCKTRRKRREIHSDIIYASAEAVKKLDEDVKSLLEEYKSLRGNLLNNNTTIAVNIVVNGDYVNERKVN